jgi:hypothetical protein
MATKITNLEYDAPSEVIYWRNPAELAISHEVEKGAMSTTEVCTDGSRIGDNVGAAGIIFVNGKLVYQLKFKLHGQCSKSTGMRQEAENPKLCQEMKGKEIIGQIKQ